MDSDLGDLETKLESFEFRMEDFNPQDEDFNFDVGDWDFSMEAMNPQLQHNDPFIDDIDKLLDDFYNHPAGELNNQSRHEEVIEQKPEGDANEPSSPGSQAFIDRYKWTQNNLPVGVSFNSDLPAATPGFMHGWNYMPEEQVEDTKKPKDGDQVIFMSSRGTAYRAEMVTSTNSADKKPDVRRSSRRTIAPRIPFPNPRPAWTMLATDFINLLQKNALEPHPGRNVYGLQKGAGDTPEGNGYLLELAFGLPWLRTTPSPGYIFWHLQSPSLYGHFMSRL
ncbi:uncharacterized protein F4812DRAFT_457295 [Daldinia caldariorum]|uniref:uncharacterized protein n=1 Tax=Daldinia caldariorum TaxID=326644 RepID=UPI00200752BA|nr:uncharacterized protein F4812DRAFT_457295 [Daldinia caldariorum]KAI1469892.1 hypothetical protein F4812DRAFT_457295 [Daldinia caldariorum]